VDVYFCKLRIRNIASKLLHLAGLKMWGPVRKTNNEKSKGKNLKKYSKALLKGKNHICYYSNSIFSFYKHEKTQRSP
jgi:hypothetical protein